MNRRRFLSSTASLGVGLLARPYIARAAAREILIAEPVHGIGYLPLYIAMSKGFFDEADVSVSLVTIESGGGHTNAVLSGQAFAFIGGPEHNAFAKAKGAELRTVVHCVDRGNIYYCAAQGLEPTNTDWPEYFRHKTIAIGPYGGTPNSITRYFLKKWKLDAKRDVTLIETANSATIAVVKGKQAQIGEATEPYVTQGVRHSIWGEPFINVPKELGPYAYSTFNVRLDTIQKDPELVRAFVRGMVKGLKFLDENHAEIGRDRQEAVSDHAARRPQGDARSLVCGQSVEQGRHGQSRSLDHRACGRAQRRCPQDRRQIRRDHRYELRRQHSLEPLRCADAVAPAKRQPPTAS